MLATVAITAMLLASSALAAQPSKGFVTYKVTLSTPMGQHSVTVNETVKPSPKAGYSDLVLQLVGTEQNFSYARFVNSSYPLFPYLPSLATQSFDYSQGKYSVYVNLTASGTKSVTFKGTQYTMSVLTFTASAENGTKSVKVNGTVEAFPSALVYSVEVGKGPIHLQAVLQATNLPLTQGSTMTTAAYVGAGLGIGALSVGGAFLIRRRGKKTKEQGDKPLHWVD
jgi:hypothetical protein